MKRILKRSTLILLFTLLFIGGAAFFCVELVMDADAWANQPYNAHISGNGGLEQAGAIYDRNGAALAKTQGNQRVYHEDYSVRAGLLHTVGDNSLNISTAVQSKYRSQLTGYSLIWGLNMPQSLRTSHDLTLTVDASACADTYDALSSYGTSGACVVYNYKTGEVLCSVSTKTYDPQDPPTITEDNESEYEGVYLDHVLSSTYTPGSIFKLVTSVAAIENIPDLFERSWYCGGHEDIGGNEVTCVDSQAHGYLDFQGALTQSCNIVFAELAVEIGSEKMNATAQKMGINMSFEIDDVDTPKGHYNTAGASVNQLAWSGVGQYDNQVNPMQMAIICGAIANGGNSTTPTYIKKRKKSRESGACQSQHRLGAQLRHARIHLRQPERQSQNGYRRGRRGQRPQRLDGGLFYRSGRAPRVRLRGRERGLRQSVRQACRRDRHAELRPGDPRLVNTSFPAVIDMIAGLDSGMGLVKIL